MSADHLGRVMALFEEVYPLEGVARAAVLDTRCGDDSALRSDVEAMLVADQEPRGPVEPARGVAEFLSAHTFTGVTPPATRDTLPVLSGQYRIIRVLGEGGMGTVYEAEQVRPRRKVALKAIRAGLASRQVLKRFEHEAHILGRLHHPGIAQIYEGGASGGEDGSQAYFAMEYVSGKPLTDHSDENRLSVKQRLELIIKVCEAVQHAHQRGVIHRDLKPSNILVADEKSDSDTDTPIKMQEHSAVQPPGDAAAESKHRTASLPAARNSGSPNPQPKILDFGVARLLEMDHDQTTMHTIAGQIVGTLSYMSPEQIFGDPNEVDTRCDIYALGVILYQLLSGQRPLDLQSCSLPEAARSIRDEQPARLGTVNRACRGEIETIVAKCLEKDRTRRYQSAADLAADLRRHLNGQPIEAKRDSTWYVASKTIRRHFAVAGAAALFLVLLAAFGIISFRLAQRNGRLAREETAERLRADALRERADATLDRAEAEKRRADETSRRLEVELGNSNIERGRLLGRSGDIRAAENLLWKEYLRHRDYPPARWGVWELYSRQPTPFTLVGNSKPLNCVAESPDGQMLASAGQDRVIQLWDSRTLECVATLAGHSGDINSIAFTPDGRSLVSASSDATIRVWDLATRGCRQTLNEKDVGNVLCVAVMPDSRRIIASTNTGMVVLHDIETGERLQAAESGQRGTRVVAVRPDGRGFAVGGDNATVTLWDYDDESDAGCAMRKTTVLNGHTRWILSLAYSHDGKLLSSGSDDRWVRVWDAATGAELAAFKPSNGAIRGLAFRNDDRTLVVSGWWSIDQWDVQTRQRLTSQSTRTQVPSIALSRDDSTVLCACDDGLRARDLNANRCLTRMSAHKGRVYALDISRDGRLAVSGGDDRRIQLIDLLSGSVLPTQLSHNEVVHSVAFNADASLIASASADGVIKLWQRNDGKCLATMRGYSPTGQAFALSPDGSTLVTGRMDGKLVVWDVPSGRQRVNLSSGAGEVIFVHYTPDGKSIVSITRDHHIRFWDAATLAPTKDVKYDIGGALWTFDIAPDNRTIAIGTWYKTIELWDFVTDTQLGVLEGHSQLVTNVRFDPLAGGRILASSSNDGSIVLWDTALKTRLVTLEADAGDASEIRFLPQSAPQDRSTRLAATYADGSVGLWDLTYYDSHIAGNAEVQVENLKASLGDAAHVADLRAWAVGVRRGIAANAPGKPG